MYSITFHCPDYDVFKNVLKSLDEIAKKKEGIKKNDNRTIYMKELHKKTKEFHEAHDLIPYKECLSIIAEQMKDEKERQDVNDIVNELIEISDEQDY